MLLCAQIWRASACPNIEQTRVRICVALPLRGAAAKNPYHMVSTRRFFLRVAVSAEARQSAEIDNTGAATGKLVRKLAAKYERLTFCYEAGPTGYGLYRQVKRLGPECMVVAPSLIPQKPGERVKTNRRDALSLVKQLRAGDLTAVWAPDSRHEAMRDLTRAREAAVEDLRCKRQQVSAFLLRQGLHYTAMLMGRGTGTRRRYAAHAEKMRSCWAVNPLRAAIRWDSS